MALDPIALSQALIRRPSVTPEDAGALLVLEDALTPMGFACTRLRFEAPNTAPVDNLYARLGEARPNFCFAGHTDVVPHGDMGAWRFDPYAASIHDGVLYGRGASDMKSAIAAFAAASSRFIENHGKPKGAISLLITGDEEGVAVNGTVKVLEWLKAKGEALDHCIVGEPTSGARTGDVMKIGRRGSINFRISVKGTQGHVAYPQRAHNPIPIMAELISRIAALELDRGSDNFDPSTLAFTTVDVGNPAVNVIPGEAQAGFNIRFNDLHTPESLVARIGAVADSVRREHNAEIQLTHSTSGVSFVTKPGAFTGLLSRAVKRAAGFEPEHSTSGGTSDARFIKDHCPVAELGLPGASMHRVDECARVADIEILTRIYLAILEDYFAGPPR